MQLYKGIVIMLLCSGVSDQLYSGYFDRLTPDPQGWMGKAIAPLQAGHQYSEAEKEEARKAIIVLDKERVAILLKLSSSPGMSFLQKELRDIEELIYEQKLITGEVWSTRRRVVLGALALAGLAAFGYGSYRLYQYIYQPSQEAVYAALDKVRAIEDRKYTTRADALKNKHDLAQARLELESALQRVSYKQPASVQLDNVPALKKRLLEIDKQQYIPPRKDGLVIMNPNFNPHDLVRARQEYIDALALPQNSHYVSELQKQVESYSGSYANLRSLEDTLNQVKKKIVAHAHYVSPPMVDIHDPEALQKRLEEIKKNSHIAFGNKSLNYSDYTNQRLAREDYEAALSQYRQAYVLRVGYSSPASVADKDDIGALGDRLDAIKKQMYVAVAGKEIPNPSFNSIDYQSADSEYKAAVLAQRDNRWRELQSKIWNENLSTAEKFEVVNHLPPYSNAVFSVSGDVKGAFKMLPEQDKLELLAKAYPYKPVAPVNLNDFQAVMDRAYATEEQSHIKYGDKVYKNISFNEADYKKALEDLKNAYAKKGITVKDPLGIMQQYEGQRNLKAGLTQKSWYEWLFGSSKKPVEVVPLSDGNVVNKAEPVHYEIANEPSLNEDDYSKRLERLNDLSEAFIREEEKKYMR